ncbi:hypothetical protein [Comamonas granuli]|uniref:hypothetical protein n=1 Tax=Comamonas granuli TaxID=290309 RepID=UPI0005A8209F|nr:hypothetical protein [Comamonas granuli]
MSTRLKKIDLANALGVDPSLITRYTDRGMPTTSVAAALEWKERNIRPRVKVASVENPGLFDYDQSRAKREHFAALQAEAQARKELGELVEIADVERMAAQMGTTIRLALEGLPAMLAPQICGRSEEEIVGVLASNVERVLAEMSRTLDAMGEAESARGGRHG